MSAARATWRGVARARSRRSGARSLSPPLTNRSNSAPALDERLDRQTSADQGARRHGHATRREAGACSWRTAHTCPGVLGRAPSSPQGNGQADGVSHRRRPWALSPQRKNLFLSASNYRSPRACSCSTADGIKGEGGCKLGLHSCGRSLLRGKLGASFVLFLRLRGKDSNLDYLIQSQASYH